jgi:putative inorganic carbon (HCO3(-)) transporter
VLAAYVFILAYVALVYVRPQDYVPELQGLTILPVFLGLSLLCWLPARGKSFEAAQHILLPVLVVYAALVIALRGWVTGGITAFNDMLPAMVVFYVVATTTITLPRHRLLMKLILACGLVLAFHGIDQVQAGIGWSGAELSQGTRITYIGLFNDPNDLAVVFVVVLPMLGYLFSESRWLGKLVYAVAACPLLYAIYLTNSRGGMLAALTQFLVYAAGRYGYVKAGIAGAIAASGLLMLPSRLDQLDADEASAAGRVDAWYAGLEMLRAYPLFGVGKDNFSDHHGLAAHNMLVLGFAELGLVGYFFWLSFLSLSIYMVWRVARTTAEQAGPPVPGEDTPWAAYQKISRTYFYSMVGFFVTCFFLSRTFNMQLFLLCAMCTGIYQCSLLHFPALPRIRMSDLWGKLIGLEVASIIGMFIVVRVLL